ncbi:MAG: bifunctional hydroxymethylpyrimidine kinase/phosphomethylpyrimidine kinase [Deltaproteobacteria bacterium]|jgi:hydroxymethylpyrimidine/phosphomethylpyrimidine kinase|nr:bifunctional hydroxymethylpyrimidine kinase/phosphomethylpyrimidine kinase [Deltaproteobacteria bacterium]
MSDVAVLPLTRALTVASSDSGGGAGLQADLKTFAALGVYGLCAVSAVTAQNTVAVTAMECLSPALLTAQLEAVFDDFPVEAVKIGLLGNKANAEALADFMERLDPRPPAVLDPVMVSAAGHTFLPPDAVEALFRLMPLCRLTTPNIPEAEALTGVKIADLDDCLKAAEALKKLGAQDVLVKGGHAPGQKCVDLFFGADGPIWLTAPRVETKNDHGTGCSLSAAVAACLARGETMEESVHLAKLYVKEGLKHGLSLGHGHGPLNHFYRLYDYK